MERNVNARRDGAYPDTEQLYRQLLRLGAAVEEIRTAVRAIRRQVDALAAGRRAADEGENEA